MAMPSRKHALGLLPCLLSGLLTASLRSPSGSHPVVCGSQEHGQLGLCREVPRLCQPIEEQEPKMGNMKTTNYGTEGVGDSQFFLEPKTAWSGATQFSCIASLRQWHAAEIVILSSVRVPNVLRFKRITETMRVSHTV